MKFRTIYAFIILFILSTSIFGQVRRVVLLEEATQASCGPCAANNPGLQKFFRVNFGGVISVRYHSSWPGNDPMYDINTADNRARINYYGISGVPEYVMNGDLKGVPSNPDAILAQMQDDLQTKAPVKIEVEANTTSDSIFATVRVIGVTVVSQTNLKLRTSIIERMIVYSSPPGTNGEKVFPDVMRKMLPDVAGIDVAAIIPGDTLTYNFSTELNSAWNKDDLVVVSWLQSETDKEIIQSNINLPTYIIETEEANAELIQTNQSYIKMYNIVNDNKDTLKIRLKPTVAEFPSTWSLNISYDNGTYDSVDVSIAPGDTLSFETNFTTTDEIGSINFVVLAQNLEDKYNYGFSISYFGVIKNGAILFVDDDGGSSAQNSYFLALDSLKVDYTAIEQKHVTALENELSSAQFDLVIWNVGWGFPAFTAADIGFLTAYLDNGGMLLLGGQDIGWDTFDGNGSSNFQAAKDFYHNYLDANYVSDDSQNNNMEGVPGSIFGGISFTLNNFYGGTNRYPEVIVSRSGVSISLLRYTGTSKIGALAHDNGTYQTIYMGVGLEQINSADIKIVVMDRVLNWFGVITDVEDEYNGLLPTVYDLSQNYPNPFNPATLIRYQLSQAGKVSLKVYDLLGKQVANLVDEFKEAGKHSVEFNSLSASGGQGLGSGVYFYTIRANDFRSTKKMMLIK